MYQYRARLIRVVDGDTMHLAIDLGLDIATQMTVRIAGVNAPEMGTLAGKQAQLWAVEWFYTHAAIPPTKQITQAKEPTVELTDWPLTVNTVKDRKEKYGRYLAQITTADGHVFNDDILTAGHAVEYNP